MKKPLLLALAVIAAACSGLTTSTDMVFDSALEGPATFERVQTRIFDVSCAASGCHRAGVWPRLSAGQAYENIVDVESTQGLPLVYPGLPDSSYLYLKLLPDAEISGQRMPPGGPYLDAASLEIVRAWIERGAPRD